MVLIDRCTAVRYALSKSSLGKCLRDSHPVPRCARFFPRRRHKMSRLCEWCREPISFLDAQTSCGGAAWHTRCWNEAAEERATFLTEMDDGDGFAFRSLPDELAKSETGSHRSEVIPNMATAAAASNNRAPREVVEFPPNVPVTVALKYPQAKTVSSQYGERFMFSLADGRVMFLDPEVGGKIESLGINVRENFTITRKWDEQKAGPPTWEVARIAGEQPNGTLVVPAPPKPPASATAAPGDASRRQQSVGPSLVEEANALVDSFAVVLEHALTNYQGRIKPDEAKALLITAYIQRSKLSFVA